MRGNPSRAIDRFGLAVYVGEHGAFFPFDPFNHLAIVLAPDNPKDFANSPLFQSTSGAEATLGAQPFGTGSDDVYGSLVSKPNYSGDAPCHLNHLTLVATPEGMTDTSFINSLLAAANRYDNNLDYVPLPDPWGIGYNSNSFVSGVIKAAGGTPPSLPGWTPGYGKPIPIP